MTTRRVDCLDLLRVPAGVELKGSVILETSMIGVMATRSSHASVEVPGEFRKDSFKINVSVMTLSFIHLHADLFKSTWNIVMDSLLSCLQRYTRTGEGKAIVSLARSTSERSTCSRVPAAPNPNLT